MEPLVEQRYSSLMGRSAFVWYARSWKYGIDEGVINQGLQNAHVPDSA